MKLYDVAPAGVLPNTHERMPITARSFASHGQLYVTMTMETSFGCACFKWKSRTPIGVHDSLKTEAAIRQDFSFLSGQGNFHSMTGLDEALTQAENSAHATHLLKTNLAKPCQFTLLRGDQTKRTYAIICPGQQEGTRETWTEHKLDAKVYYVEDAYDKNGKELPIETVEDNVRGLLERCQNINQLGRTFVVVK